MNYLQRREEEQNEADQERGTQGAHGMRAPPSSDYRESRHGDDLPDSKCPFFVTGWVGSSVLCVMLLRHFSLR